MRRLLSGFAVLAALLFVSSAPAAAQQRIALVIGNAAYPGGPLAASLADGGLVAEALGSIGFEIVEGADVNQNDMRRVFRDFLEKVQAAGPDAIALVYYSGYAVPFDGENYLIPVDARLARDSDIPIETLRLFDLMRPLADAPALAKIVILDAARPLPFRVQGGRLARGLAAVESVPGMLVAFSSAPGEVAEDGPGPYGAYATAIAEMVREPGLDLDTMFARIRVRTHEATNGQQTPWEVSQLNQVVMLVPGAPLAPPAGASQGLLAPQTAMGAPPVRRPPRPMTGIGAEEAYTYAIEQDDLPSYVEYVRVYPNSPYAQRIWARIRARREALAWRRALLFNTPEAYWTYLQRYPDGMYAYDAERRLRRLSAGLRPPPGFRMLEFDDVPPPVAGEPARLFDVYPAAPPPPRRLAPPPAFIVTLPPPPRRDYGGGLWHRQQQTFPVIIAPPAGPRPGFGGAPAQQGQPPQGQQKGPAVVSPTPPGALPPAPPPGGPPQGQKGFGGPPPGFKGPGQGQQGQPGQGQQKGPAVVNQPPPAPPPGGPPPAPPQGQPKVVNQPPPGPPPGSPPPGGPPPGALPQGQPKIVTQPPGSPPPGGPPPGVRSLPPGGPAAKGPPPQQQLQPPPQVKAAPPPPPPQVKAPTPPPPPPPPQVKAAPPPPPPPPQVKAVPPPPPPPPQVKAPPPPPPPPPQVKAPPPPPPPPPQVRTAPPPPPPPQAQKGPPPGKGPPGKKCEVVNGQQVCK